MLAPLPTRLVLRQVSGMTNLLDWRSKAVTSGSCPCGAGGDKTPVSGAQQNPELHSGRGCDECPKDAGP